MFTPQAAQADIDLVLSASSGNAAAFETIVRTHNRLLFRTARGVVGDDAEAQDVVQETYLRAFRNLDTFRGESSLGTWLARIAINVAVSALRKTGRLVQWPESASPGDADLSETMTPLIPDNQKPDEMAEGQELRALLQSSMEDLPPIYRSVFILRAVEELSVQETAFCLSVSEDVVKTRFLRSRSMLKERLALRVEPAAQNAFQFAGARCDAVLAQAMAALLAEGRIRSH